MTTADTVIAEVEAGATIGIGGLLSNSHPMPLIRALIRARVPDLHIVGTAQGLEVDMLIAAGLVRRVTLATVSGDPLTMIGPAFRRAAQMGTLEVAETDEGLIYAALLAAAHQIDFMPWGAGVGTSIPDLNADRMEIIGSPFTGRPVTAVRALPLDYAFLHATEADVFGNVRYVGGAYGDRAIARAARRIVVTVDRIVPNSSIRRDPGATAYSGVTNVIHAPFGSHPFGSPGEYIHDEPILRAYLAAAGDWLRGGDRAKIDEFFRFWFEQSDSHWDYLDQVGAQRLHNLSEALHWGDVEAQ